MHNWGLCYGNCVGGEQHWAPVEYVTECHRVSVGVKCCLCEYTFHCRMSRLFIHLISIKLDNSSFHCRVIIQTLIP